MLRWRATRCELTFETACAFVRTAPPIRWKRGVRTLDWALFLPDPIGYQFDSRIEFRPGRGSCRQDHGKASQSPRPKPAEAQWADRHKRSCNPAFATRWGMADCRPHRHCPWLAYRNPMHWLAVPQTASRMGSRWPDGGCRGRRASQFGFASSLRGSEGTLATSFRVVLALGSSSTKPRGFRMSGWDRLHARQTACEWPLKMSDSSVCPAKRAERPKRGTLLLGLQARLRPARQRSSG